MKTIFNLLLAILFCQTVSFAQKEYLHIINSNFVEFDFNTKDFKPNIKNKFNLFEIYQNSDLANLNVGHEKFTFVPSYFGTICDNKGDLLLYSDARHIFDSDNKLIYRNDKSINIDIFTRTVYFSIRERLLTDSAGAVSTQILKKPGCNNEYYLLYTTHNYVLNQSIQGDTLSYKFGFSLYYYNFEYTKQAGIKMLSDPILLADSVLPHIAICKAENNIDNWIVTRKYIDNTYISFKFNDNGINKNYVSSKFDNYINNDTNITAINYSTRGFAETIYSDKHLSISPDSKILYSYYDILDIGYKTRLFSFDNSNGKLIDLKVNPLKFDSIAYNRYATFSNSSKYLYTSGNINISLNENKRAANQFDISNLSNNNYNYNYFYYLQSKGNYNAFTINGYYNRMIYSTEDASKPIPKYSLTEIFNSDSSADKIRVRLNSIKKYYHYDTSGALISNFKDLSRTYQRPLPGGYYGVDIYKEKCPKDSIRLAIHFELDEKDSIYEWTGPNGFTSKQRNPILYNVRKENQGWYDLKVYDPKIDCYRNFALHLEVKDSAEAPIIGSSTVVKNKVTYIKANEFLKLFSTNNLEKVWSTGETGDTITVNKAGRYTLRLNTDRWCENVTYIDVVEDSVVVIAADDANFNQHKISDPNTITKKIRINCESFQYDLKVYSYTNSNPDVFETNLPQLGGTTIIQFKPGGYYEFEVKFKPKEKRKYFDSIVFFSNARIIDNVTYLYGEGVDSIASVEDEPKVITDITQSTHIELYDILGRSIATFTNYEKLKAEIENYPPPHLIKWRDEKGIFHFEKMK